MQPLLSFILASLTYSSTHLLILIYSSSSTQHLFPSFVSVESLPPVIVYAMLLMITSKPYVHFIINTTFGFKVIVMLCIENLIYNRIELSFQNQV